MVDEINREELAETLYQGISLFVGRLWRLQHGNLAASQRNVEPKNRGARSSSSVVRLVATSPIVPGTMSGARASSQAGESVRGQSDLVDDEQSVIAVTALGIDIVQRLHDSYAWQLAQELAEGFCDEELRLLAAVAPVLARLGSRS